MISSFIYFPFSILTSFINALTQESPEASTTQPINPSEEQTANNSSSSNHRNNNNNRNNNNITTLHPGTRPYSDIHNSNNNSIRNNTNISNNSNNNRNSNHNITIQNQQEDYTNPNNNNNNNIYTQLALDALRAGIQEAMQHPIHYSARPRQPVWLGLLKRHS